MLRTSKTMGVYDLWLFRRKNCFGKRWVSMIKHGETDFDVE